MRGPRRWLVIPLRILVKLTADMRNDDITMRAMGLVYTTLVSLVPLLALAFSLLKAFGVHDVLRPALTEFLAPLGSGSEAIVDKVVGFVANIQVGVLGVVGVIVLLFSVLSLIQKVESGCNFIWGIDRTRPLGRRVTEYISILVVGPLVVFAAISMTATVSNNAAVAWLTSVEPFGTALYLAGRLLPYLLYSVAFILLFKFIPHTRVNWLPALGGGLFSGILWQTASHGFAVFARNAGNINAIYSGFASIILLLIWLYVSWLILLLGCRIAYLLQHPAQLTRTPQQPYLGAAEHERLALLIAAEVADRFLRGAKPWQVRELAQTLRAVPMHVQNIADQLIDAGIFVHTQEDETLLLPQRDIAEVRLTRVLHAVRAGAPGALALPEDTSTAATINNLMVSLDATRERVFGDYSLRDLALSLHHTADDAVAASSTRVHFDNRQP